MKIKKTFQGTIPENKILNSNSTSQTDTYSCEKINEMTEEIYSTEETVIGKWIDGKPLYRKVFISECPGNTDISIQHGINGIFVVNANGIGVYNNSIFFPIPYAVAGSNTQSSYAITQETINVSSKAGDLRTFYITLEYTKTTD